MKNFYLIVHREGTEFTESISVELIMMKFDIYEIKGERRENYDFASLLREYW
jgi:hypothetical protein